MGRNEQIKMLAALCCDVILFDGFLRLRNHFSTGVFGGEKSAPVWLAVAFALYLANLFYLKKERSLSGLAVFNIILGIPALIAVYRSFAPLHGIWTYLIFAAGAVFVHARIVNRFFEPVTIDSSIRFFEMSAVEYLFYQVYRGYTGISGNLGALLFLSLLISLAAVIFGRIEGAGNTDSEAGRRGLTVIFGILGGMAAVCAVFGLFFTDAAGGLIGGLVDNTIRLVKGIGHVLGAFLYWLMSLFPEPELSPMEMESPPPIETPELDYALETNEELLLILGVAAAVIAVATVGILLWRLRKVKLGVKTTARHGNAVQRGGMKLMEMLKQLAREIVTAVRGRLQLFRIRNTVSGVVLAIERENRRGPYEKYHGETHGAYLRRLAGVLEMRNMQEMQDSTATVDKLSVSGNEKADEALPDGHRATEEKPSGNGRTAEKLRRIADEFERQYYAGERAVVYASAEARGIRREVRNDLHSLL